MSHPYSRTPEAVSHLGHLFGDGPTAPSTEEHAS